MARKFLYYSLIFLIVCACKSKNKERSDNFLKKFGAPSGISYARKLAIDEGENYYLVKIMSPFTDANDTLYYALTKKNCKKEFPSNYNIINIPIRSAAILSSSHASMFLPFDKAEVITAVSQINYFYSEEIHDRYNDGKISEVGMDSNLNFEEIIAKTPEILMISGNSVSDLDKMELLKSSGITIIPNAEWREHHPLGRAEWIKLGGALLDQMDEANEIFSKVERSYLGLRHKAMEAKHHPEVLVNAPFKSSWWIPSGTSYIAQLLFDAGANYPWSETQQEKALQLDLESVMNTALDADVWINPGTAQSAEELLAKDQRLENFKAFREKKVFNHTLKINEHGGNDYFEKGVIRPDLILADLIKIFHPGLLKDQEFNFYQKLE